MNKREQFINYVKNGGEKFCSPQIGAGAGFDTKFAGKDWVSETTINIPNPQLWYPNGSGAQPL